MLKIIKLIMTLLSFSAFVLTVSAIPAHAGPDQIYTSWRNNQAVDGYDVVSFHSGNPIKGKAEISTIWNGAQWQFATQANLDNFLDDPQKYAPAYGGYCAWALAKNKLAKGSPKYWTVIDEILYLNFSKNIQTRWLKNTGNFIKQGDKNWPKLLD